MMMSQASSPAHEYFTALQVGTFRIGDQEVRVETGRLARSARAAVTLQVGNTMVYSVVSATDTPREGIDFFPLLCDFEEKMYAVGRLPGGYLKREGRPSEKATLISRLMDRPIRPLWPEGYRNDVHVISSILSSDEQTAYDTLAVTAASIALSLSGLPFQGPLGCVRVGRVEGAWVINPSFAQQAISDLDLIVAATEDSIMMVEAGAQFVSEADLVEALEVAHEAIQSQIAFQKEFQRQCNKAFGTFVPSSDLTPLHHYIAQQCEAQVEKAYHEFDRETRQNLLAEAKEALKTGLVALGETHELNQLIASLAPIQVVSEGFKSLEKKVMRRMIMEEGVRADGRKPTEIRPIHCEVGLIPLVHGSALFTRGSTQVLSICTLGSPGDAQDLDGVDPQTKKRWLHHYAFPAYSVGEVRPLRAPGRREIGHGALAERAVSAALPCQESFPYTMRVNSEVVESNGSTSMASTCGSSLALMNAGVPLKSHVSGIAMGLIKEGDRYVVLSDIQGVEDFLGDMDFKVTGDRYGVTALQMDIKIKGISIDIMRQALEQAQLGRLHILGLMEQAIVKAGELAPTAPRIFSMQIDTDQIGTVIGPGGKMIRSIIDATGAAIDIDDSGRITITAKTGEAATAAMKTIEGLTRKFTAGLVLPGKVVRVIPIGAFVEIAPGKDGLIHISQLAPRRVEKVEDVVNVGDELVVKVIDVDDRGRINLSLKAVTEEERASVLAMC
jgi:polyribonucleotide nucleotidyltransferase